MMGSSIEDLRAEGLIPAENARPNFFAVKEAVLPWDRFPDEDIILGPEMRATGEVMGIAESAGLAYGKALLAAGMKLPQSGNVFLSLADRDKAIGLAAAQAYTMRGFTLYCTPGTSRYLNHHGVPNVVVDKVGESENDTLALIEGRKVQLVINTPRGSRARTDGWKLRIAAQHAGIPCVTTVQGALAAARSLQEGPDALLRVRSLQDWHR
jgi:carbamoyl-phosphate synthase large subunit